MSFAWLRKMTFSIRITIALLVNVLVVAIALPLLHGSDGTMTLDLRSAVPVKFLYRDSRAQRVCVTGSFNEWSPHAHCMKRESDVWSITVLLSPGRYQYLFLIDDKVRKKDPGALLAQYNGFGEENSVLVVE